MIDLVKNSLAAKVSLIISSIVLLSAFVVGGVLYFAGDNLVVENHYHDLELKSNLLYEKFDNQFNYFENLFKLISHAGDEAERIALVIKDERFLDENIIGYRILNKESLVLTEDNAIKLKNSTAPKAQIVSGLSLTEVLLDEEGRAYIQLTMDLDQLIVEIIYDFQSFLEESTRYFRKNPDDGLIYLINGRGEYLFHPSEFKRFSSAKEIKYTIFEEFSHPSLEEFIKEKGKGALKLQGSYQKKKTLNLIKPFSRGPNLLYYFVFAEKKKLTPFHRSLLKSENIIILLLMFLGFSFLGWFSVRYLLTNLDEITLQAQKFTQGHHDIDIHVKSGDEIGILALTFQGMVRQVNERTRVLKKSERRIREARDQAEDALKSKSHLLEDLRKQKAEIERVSKDKDDLLAIVSHDLKNPLAVVETSMDLILEEERDRLGATANDLIRRSKNSARVALNLITDLLDLSRLEGGIRLDLERFNVEDMVNSVVDGYYLKSKEKNIEVKIEQQEDYDLLADYGRIIQVLSNLLGNSLKFTPANGKIKINVGEYESKYSYNGSYRGLEISITDTGPGIPEDKLDSIFNKFEQARKKDREIGTGLGLTISKNICELHNGEIFVDSEAGKGATFTIRIPRLLIGNKNSEVIKKENLSILIANDEASFRKEAKLIFGQNNYQIIEAKNGEELLLLLESNHPDLIILDADMPVKNGVETLFELKDKKGFKIPLLLIGEAGLLKDPQFETIKDLVNDVISPETLMKDIYTQVDTLLKSANPSDFVKNLDSNKKTVLVVDDEEGIRVLLQESLQSSGYNVIAAKSGVEALFLVQKYRVDLVISDIRMTEVDGIRLTKSVKELYPHVVVFLMSANVDSISDTLLEKLGVRRSFSKPFEVDEISMAVNEDIGGSFLSEGKSILREKTNEPKVVESVSSVLLVDDSEDMQILFKVLLRKEKLDLTIANNGLEAVQIYKEKSFDAVFMDMNMPEMSGKEAVIIMRELEKTQKERSSHIVLLTADSFDSEDDARELGFDSYIQKPLSKDKVIDQMAKAKAKKLQTLN